MQQWPDIPYARWRPTGASLHMWLQIIGKFRLAQTPWMIHSWQATFYVTSRGITTGLIPGAAESYSIDVDLLRHELRARSTAGKAVQISLESMSVAEFHERFIDAIAQIGAPTAFHNAPNELPTAIPFSEQIEAGSYDPDAAHDFWRALVSVTNVFSHFRTSFVGKTSPVHLFWGSFDLAVTRFSGRPAPLHPGGVPNLPDAVTREAYSHEVSSAGFWAGGGGVDYPAFYSYAYPTPDGFKNCSPGHEEAFYSDDLGEFVLPYDAVRNAPKPEAALLGFLEATYLAAAKLGRWDRAVLECDLGRPAVPRPLE
ncbi:MAG: DUF5996 family protein [Pseudomonadota bacterium]